MANGLATTRAHIAHAPGATKDTADPSLAATRLADDMLRSLGLPAEGGKFRYEGRTGLFDRKKVYADIEVRYYEPRYLEPEERGRRLYMLTMKVNPDGSIERIEVAKTYDALKGLWCNRSASGNNLVRVKE